VVLKADIAGTVVVAHFDLQTSQALSS